MHIKECLIELKNCLIYYFLGKKIKISLCGLSKSGKTSFCNAYNGRKVLKKERPTHGSRKRPFVKNGIRGMFNDIGGAVEYTNLMDFSYRSSDALFFFVNASEPSEFSNAKHMLLGLLDRNKKVNVPILIMCTHNDIHGYAKCQNIALEMCLDSFLGKDISCYSISSLTLSNFAAVEEWITKHAK
ncbi:ADP-ribosylation factor-like protein 8 [Nematocida minor]|uniref:ADP-ribosylation factor-like protein 8 n=1 Tax=Nematocida minor TaxID=1912983 RepID=UPI00221F74B1|nr:ADP-ribosylation factor-like protein 8 [Nematocida minor]KAI5191769.1 ADP-ribosylation factor-like protein 8 [Nematocida minor]